MLDRTTTSAAVPPFWRWLVRCAGLLPVAVLVLSFFMLVQISGTVPLFGIPVHEDGERSFFQTVFYFEHAAREWPLDVILGAAIGCSSALALRARPHAKPAPAFLWAGLATGAILVGSIFTVGPLALLDNLMQSHTRPDAELVVGSHWYFHFLGHASLIISVIAIGLMLRGMTYHSTTRNGKTAPRSILMMVIVFAAISAIFALRPGLVALSLTDPVYLGHQAREVFTNALVTIPLGFYCCARVAQSPTTVGAKGPQLWAGTALLLLAVVIALYIARGAVAGDALAQAQSVDMRVLIFPHFFEHTFTYIIATCVAVGTFLKVAK